MTPFAKVRLAFIISILALLAVDLWMGLSNLYYVVPVVVFLTFLFLSTTSLSMNAFAEAYTQPQLSEGKIAITFDDGPSPQTINVLEVLKKHDAKATFFCIGHKLEQYGDIVEQMADAGHTVGNHSYSHDNFFPFYSKSKIISEINKTNSIIEGITGKPNQLFRPPFGVMNPTLASAIKEANQQIIGWNIRSFDTSRQKNRVVENVKKQLKPGAVILLHDDRENTPEILEAILLEAKKQRLHCVDVKEIFKL